MRLAVVGGLAGVVLGCARPPGTDGVENACQPVSDQLVSGTNATDLSGAYGLTLVATGGDSTGRTVSGRLELGPATRQDAVLVGKTDVPVAVVGALRLGRLASAGDAAPGVLVMQSGADRPTIALRLGSDANAAGTVRFDGGYTVLEVLRTDNRGFAGSWRSGIVSNSATGHFCAVRAADQAS